MSKKSKALSKQSNLQKKRAIKSANKAKFSAWRAAGENCKSTRAVRNSKNRRSPNKGKHLIAHCGNLACKRCFTHDEKGVRAKTKN